MQVVLVDDDHAAGADDGAGRGKALVVDRRVEQVRRHAAAGRAAELHGLELLAVLDAAADVEDDVAAAWMPMGTSTRPPLTILPASAKALVPLQVSVP